jgi:hypothetical protein
MILQHATTALTWHQHPATCSAPPLTKSCPASIDSLRLPSPVPSQPASMQYAHSITPTTPGHAPPCTSPLTKSCPAFPDSPCLPLRSASASQLASSMPTALQHLQQAMPRPAPAPSPSHAQPSVNGTNHALPPRTCTSPRPAPGLSPSHALAGSACAAVQMRAAARAPRPAACRVSSRWWPAGTV